MTIAIAITITVTVTIAITIAVAITIITSITISITVTITIAIIITIIIVNITITVAIAIAITITITITIAIIIIITLTITITITIQTTVAIWLSSSFLSRAVCAPTSWRPHLSCAASGASVAPRSLTRAMGNCCHRRQPPLGGWYLDGSSRITVEVKVELRDGSHVRGSGVMTAGDEMKVIFEHNKGRELVGKVGDNGDIHWSNGRVWKHVA